MAKIILVVLGLMLVYWILRSYRRRIDRRDRPPHASAGEDMVRCDQCGVHLPRSESLTTRGHFFCSAEHQQQYLRSD